MRLVPLVILILFVTVPAYGQTPASTTEMEPQTYDIPELAQVGEGALLRREFIYSLDNKPTRSAHASTIMESPEGILIAFFAGTNEGAPDVGIRLSVLQDSRWSWPVEVANGFINDTLRYPTWNPVLFQPAGGALQLYYKLGPTPSDWWGMVKTSADNGRTWTDGTKLGKHPAIGHLVGPVKNKPVQLADGTLLSPSSTETTVDGDIRWQLHVERSTDGGRSWDVIGPLNDGITFDAIQPSILEFADGRLMMMARTRQDVVAQTWSEDRGMSWSEPVATHLPNPDAGTDALTLRDGRQLLIYNHKLKRNGERGRDHLNLAISDDGVTWTTVLTLENAPSEFGYAYPAIIQSADGLLHISYTHNREAIKYAVVDPSKL
ncbi:hypothetical protein LEM8419_00121 [Neolewinella maritima]|uniref:Sialidase domain-containing protein n=1 Tax=Neolewinella maritima TaxID=1383882 RepID=A0ABN8EYI1_9BACT|nr:sialidase family protein [Neolewinella maritima]CAH0998782.1 hypothetical protein LEM8419_00121 [Neolewinella maritima]